MGMGWEWELSAWEWELSAVCVVSGGVN